MALQHDVPASTRPYRLLRARPSLLLWADDETVVTAPLPLMVGRTLTASVFSAPLDLEAALLARGVCSVRLRGRVAPLVSHPAVAVPRVHGEVLELQAVTCSFRLHPGGEYRPAHDQLRTVPVHSSTEALPSRSVWAPSGAHVLLGFLVRLRQQAG